MSKVKLLETVGRQRRLSLKEDPEQGAYLQMPCVSVDAGSASPIRIGAYTPSAIEPSSDAFESRECALSMAYLVVCYLLVSPLARKSGELR